MLKREILIIIVFIVLSGEDIVKVLKTAAVDPAIYRQYILYFFIGRFIIIKSNN